MKDRTHPEAYALFLDQWNIYRKVIQGDYMRHRALFHEAETLIRKQSVTSPIILDLGCGDAAAIKSILDGLPYQQYVGVDGSAFALNAARETLSHHLARSQLIESDLRDYLRRPSLPKHDIIFASFAIHHLTHLEKSECLNLIRTSLRDDGIFILVDIVKTPEESRESYLTRLCEEVETHWHLLSKKEKESVTAHIQLYDHPASLPDLQQIANINGFKMNSGERVLDLYQVTSFN